MRSCLQDSMENLLRNALISKRYPRNSGGGDPPEREELGRVHHRVVALREAGRGELGEDAAPVELVLDGAEQLRVLLVDGQGPVVHLRLHEGLHEAALRVVAEVVPGRTNAIGRGGGSFFFLPSYLVPTQFNN